MLWGCRETGTMVELGTQRDKQKFTGIEMSSGHGNIHGQGAWYI